MKTLTNLADRQEIARRLGQLSPSDTARWGSMNVHQGVCHLHDAFKVALGEKIASPATNLLQRYVVKWLALHTPTHWPKGVPTRPELEQGKGGSVPTEFSQDVALLLETFARFCEALPSPCVEHAMFGKMTSQDWMRWGYLHTDHHLRQFGR